MRRSRLQNLGLLILRVMRQAWGSGRLRRVGLGGGHVGGVDIHVRLSLVHCWDCGLFVTCEQSALGCTISTNTESAEIVKSSTGEGREYSTESRLQSLIECFVPRESWSRQIPLFSQGTAGTEKPRRMRTFHFSQSIDRRWERNAGKRCTGC